MRNNPSRKPPAFTLLELSIVVFLGVAIGGMLMGLFNQQLTFLRILQTQNFLVDDAPIISNYSTRIISKADGFRLYDDLGSIPAFGAAGFGAPRTGLRGIPASAVASTAVRLTYNLPNGSIRDAALFYGIPPGGGVVGLYFLGDRNPAVLLPPLLLSSRPAAVDFSIINGVLQMRLQGSNGEQIDYVGNVQQ